MPQPNLSFVIPAFNEAHRIVRTLDTIGDYFQRRSLLHEVIVVDDGSRDGTVSLVEEHAADDSSVRLIRLSRHRGKGAALRAGILEARGTSVFMSDADLPISLDHYLRAVPALRKDADMVYGIRVDRSYPSRWRRILGLGSIVLTNLLVLNDQVLDPQCPFKGFRRDTAREIFSHSIINGGAIDAELFHLARKLGLRLKAVPVHFEAVGGSTINPLRDMLQNPIEMVRIRTHRYGLSRHR